MVVSKLHEKEAWCPEEPPCAVAQWLCHILRTAEAGRRGEGMWRAQERRQEESPRQGLQSLRWATDSFGHAFYCVPLQCHLFPGKFNPWPVTRVRLKGTEFPAQSRHEIFLLGGSGKRRNNQDRDFILYEFPLLYSALDTTQNPAV